MARLLEHQAKEIIAAAGIRVPASRLCGEAAQAAQAARELGGVTYVKAQVAMGDRARGGAVRRAADPAAAGAIAGELLGSAVAGIEIGSVLVEEAITATWEGYAAITIEEGPSRRVLRFSRRGGAGFDPSTAEVVIDVDEALEPFRIRRSLKAAGVPSAELVAVSQFLARCVAVARQWCAYTLEVNPVAMTADGIVALDAKADLDDYSRAALPRPELIDQVETDERERQARQAQANDHRGSFRYVQLVGEDEPVTGIAVATHSVGGGESMVVLDALAAVGLTPTNYCDTSGSPPAEKVALAATLVAGQKHVRGLLFSTCIANQRLSVTADGLIQGWRQCGWRGPTVVRFAGNEGDQAREIVRAWAAQTGVPVVILDERSSEWDAAAALQQLLTDGDGRRAGGRDGGAR